MWGEWQLTDRHRFVVDKPVNPHAGVPDWLQAALQVYVCPFDRFDVMQRPREHWGSGPLDVLLLFSRVAGRVFEHRDLFDGAFVLSVQDHVSVCQDLRRFIQYFSHFNGGGGSVWEEETYYPLAQYTRDVAGTY